MTPDPIGCYGGDMNLYRYVSNNPRTFVDPSGMKCSPKECCCKVNKFTLDWKRLPLGPTSWGHDVNVKVIRQQVYSNNPARCELEWFEKNSNAKYGLSDVWQDMSRFAEFSYLSEDFYSSQPFDCPSKPKKWSFTDTPSYFNKTGGIVPANYERKLCIKVVITDGCTHKKQIRKFNQFLLIRNGVGLAVLPPPGTQQAMWAALTRYCSK